MNYLLKCLGCGATCWVPGAYDPTCNALELDENGVWEWDGARDEKCEHDDFDVLDEQSAYEPD